MKPNTKLIKNNPYDKIIGSKDKRVMIMKKVKREELCLISQVEPKSIDKVTRAGAPSHYPMK